jgi:hypothetical protein
MENRRKGRNGGERRVRNGEGEIIRRIIISLTQSVHTQYTSESVVVGGSNNIGIWTTSHVLSTPEYKKNI